MPSLNILISGAGITGPILAHFLAISPDNHRITVVERSPSPRFTGQNVDVRGNGLEVVRRMGISIEQAIRSKTTHEQGLRFVDGDNKVWAEFPVSKSQSFTAEIEIMRGDLASILYESTKDLDNVEYIFDEHIESLTQANDNIRATFANTKSPSAYDIVIGADGWSSMTRNLAFPPSSTDTAIHSLGQYTAYFKIPYSPEDGHWAQWYNAPGGRLLLLRPDPQTNVTRVWMSSMSQTSQLEAALTQNTDYQKETLANMFADAGWRAPRVIKHMFVSDDFYFQKIAQVKMNQWSSGRVVLVGDAAYAPSPISGMGTTVAITGAYVLAGEINRQSGDYRAAFEAYEEHMREFVVRAQKLMPGTPGMANPMTGWGIRVLNWFLWAVMVTGLNRLGGEMAVTGLVLPDYR